MSIDLLNHLPCAALVTDRQGSVQAANLHFSAQVGRTAAQLTLAAMDDFFPLESRIQLQTQVWPVLRTQGSVTEIQLAMHDAVAGQVTVLLSCQRGVWNEIEAYYWLFLLAPERNQFETEMLRASRHAEDVARELAESARFVKTITDAMPSMVTYWDRDLRCHFANQPFLEWFGIAAEDVIGSNMQALLGEELFARNEVHVRAVLAGERQQFERTLTKSDGSTGNTLAHYIPDRNTAGEVDGFYALVSDVTYIKTTESELKLAASVFHNTVDGILAFNDAGRILSVNPAFSTITGYSSEEAVGQQAGFLRSPQHGGDLHATISKSLAEHGRWAGELWNRHKNGEAYLEWHSITTIAGSAETPTRHVAVFHDITERWRKDERIRHLALHDALTDLPNRQLLTERLGQLITQTGREPRQLALMFLDLDQFKQVNDTLGHDVGDELLVVVAKKLLSQVRQNDTVARLGGDEFVILLDNPLSRDYVAHIAERIVATVHTPLKLGQQQAQVGASIGIAMHPGDGMNPADLLKHADTAMYAAKRAGKNTYRFFTADDAA
ncbi:diguanylate cyclase domain-containing protein [Rhodoferax sp.]|uniref:sensor domain-containing protein n=1 Tax=Rhodoferax sp. TaxID=50421 RepID=UPI00374D4B69